MIVWGRIVLVDLDPALGGEASKTRPALVVSNDQANAFFRQGRHGMITVLPITSNVTRVYPFQVFIPAGGEAGLDRDSKIQAEQIRAVHSLRLLRELGTLPESLEAQVTRALKLHLDLL